MLPYHYWREYQKCMKDTKLHYDKCKKKYFKYRKVTNSYMLKNDSQR